MATPRPPVSVAPLAQDIREIRKESGEILRVVGELRQQHENTREGLNRAFQEIKASDAKHESQIKTSDARHEARMKDSEDRLLETAALVSQVRWQLSGGIIVGIFLIGIIQALVWSQITGFKDDQRRVVDLTQQHESKLSAVSTDVTAMRNDISRIVSDNTAARLGRR